MKALIIFLFLFLTHNLVAQTSNRFADTSTKHIETLVNFSDTSNKYSVKLPDNWSFIFPKMKMELKLTVQERPSENCSSDYVHIRVVDSLNTTFKAVYSSQLNYWHKEKDFRILDTGSFSVSEYNSQWFIEQHFDPLCNFFVFYMCSICYREGKSYILEMECLQKEGLETRRRLFLEIVKSFRLT